MGPDGGHLANVQDQGSGAQRTLLWAALKLLAEEGKEAKNAKKTQKAKAVDMEAASPASQETKRPNVLLIDEPEICLHPTAVREACKTLYDLAENDTNWQVMVTTHSPVFIDISRDHTTVVRVQRDETGKISGTTIFRPDKAELTADDQDNLKLLNLWDPYVAEFFFGGKTILVEGDTEYTAFKKIINDSPDKFGDVHIIRARGKAILLPLCKILNHFGQPYSVLHDADTPTVETKNGFQTNAMWTENQKIKDAASKSQAGVRVVASIKDFESAVFGKGAKKDKPYSSWKQLNESDDARKVVSELLEALIDHSRPLPNGFLQWGVLDGDLKSAVDQLGSMI
jgi:putative ATP-dependent endonuclease of OLD family